MWTHGRTADWLGKSGAMVLSGVRVGHWLCFYTNAERDTRASVELVSTGFQCGHMVIRGGTED